jgi:toxin ParE1/3/4
MTSVFCRAGQHFIVFIEENGTIIIVDFLHSRSDLIAKLAYLTELRQK